MSTALALATLPLVSLYTRWCSLTKFSPGKPAWDGCLFATFADPHNVDLATADNFLSASCDVSTDYLLRWRSTALAELVVRADQLQAAGDPRGEWLAIWLMPPSEHRDRAVIDSTPALAKHMGRLVLLSLGLDRLALRRLRYYLNDLERLQRSRTCARARGAAEHRTLARQLVRYRQL